MSRIIGNPTKNGPEAALVMKFIEANIFNFHSEDFLQTVFIEPQLGSTSPDIVIVFMDLRILNDWPDERLLLTNLELKVAHFLYMNGSKTFNELTTYFPRNLSHSLNRLSDAGLISFVEGRYYLNEVDNIFAARKIIAIEAKLSSLSKAIEQAYRNTWFASESYVLSSLRVSSSNEFIETAIDKGVGFWNFVDAPPVIIQHPAQLQTVPKSYGSWHFNELAWRQIKGRIHEF